MKDGNRISTEDVVLPDGSILTEADFERMALEAETTLPDMERLKARRRVGRPAFGEGLSPVFQVCLDEQTRRQLTDRAERDHRTPSEIAREAIQAWLAAS